MHFSLDGFAVGEQPLGYSHPNEYKDRALGKKTENTALRMEASRRQGRAILIGMQDITLLQTCIN